MTRCFQTTTRHRSATCAFRQFASTSALGLSLLLLFGAPNPGFATAFGGQDEAPEPAVQAPPDHQTEEVALRARDLGIPFDGEPGPLNAITDVGGVEVGHSTLIRDEPAPGRDPLAVRTGVTAIFPLGKAAEEGVAAGWASFNGAGELTGTVLLDEFGELHGPVMLTGSLNIGAVYQATVDWQVAHVTDPEALYQRVLPVVGETWDGFLHDVYGQHLKPEDVFAALDGARSGPVAEGSVGGGTGMRAFSFKAGIGTASRRVQCAGGDYVLGVLVQANFGRRSQLRIAGAPVGREIPDLLPERGAPPAPDGNSILVILATDAPLLPIQLQRLARRAALGLGRVGSVGSNGSGDLFLAFSTANRLRPGAARRQFESLGQPDPLFEAAVQATEEAVVNALVAGRTMVGVDGNKVYGLPLDRLQEILRRSGVSAEKASNPQGDPAP